MHLGSVTGILLSTLLSTLLSGGAQTTPATQAILQAFNITNTTVVAEESEQETTESVDLITAINENAQEEANETTPVIVVADVEVEKQIFTSSSVVNETAASVVEETVAAEIEEPAATVAEEAVVAVVEETATPVIEDVVIPEIQEETTVESSSSTTTSTTSTTSNVSTWNGQKLTSSAGVVDGPNGKETYYNLDMSGVVSIMENLGYDYEYWVRDDGVKMYGDYVMIAADLSSRPRGSVYETSLGYGIVVDTGSFAYSDPDQIDIAVNW